MVRKGQMHVMDAIAAVMILFFFAISGFDTAGGNDWGSFESQIAATDISYTLKQTDHLENMVEDGESGSIQGAANGLSQREFSISGQIQGVAPNLEIGFYRRPEDIKRASVEKVDSSDTCYSEVRSKLFPKSNSDILKTNASTILNNNGGRTLYLGDYKGGFSSLRGYDSIWVDRGSCNFDQPSDPIKKTEIFEWGSGNHYEFRDTDIDPVQKTGDIVVAEADQMKSFQDTMTTEVNGIANRVKLDSFSMQEVPDNTGYLDLMIFPENESIERIENQNKVDTVNNMIERKPVLFLANLNQTLVENTFLDENGFKWNDIQFKDQTGRCGTTSQRINKPCDALEVEFSTTEESENTRRMIVGQKTDFSDISLYPKGSVTTDGKGKLSFDKTMYLENFAYDKISEDRVNRGLSDHSVPDGSRPSTSCDNVTTATLDFPDKNGNVQTYNIVNTQLGNSNAYCSNNNRALYIDLDQDGGYSDENEGPYLDGERAEIRGLTYNTTVIPSTVSGCGPDDCAGFRLNENAQLTVFTHNLDSNVGRAPYENSYSSADRKAISAFIYTMGGSTKISGDSESKVSSTIYGSASGEPFRINLRWEN